MFSKKNFILSIVILGLLLAGGGFVYAQTPQGPRLPDDPVGDTINAANDPFNQVNVAGTLNQLQQQNVQNSGAASGQNQAPLSTNAAVQQCLATHGEEATGIWANLKACRDCGVCSLDDFIRIAVNIVQFALGIVGSLAFAMFVYGGLMMIIAAGNDDYVKKGKTIIRNAVIGLIIIFSSWTVIYFFQTIIGTTQRLDDSSAVQQSE